MLFSTHEKGDDARGHYYDFRKHSPPFAVCCFKAYNEFVEEADIHQCGLFTDTKAEWLKIREIALTTYYHGELQHELDNTKNKGQLLTNITKLKQSILAEELDITKFDEPLLNELAKKTKWGVATTGVVAATAKKASM